MQHADAQVSASAVFRQLVGTAMDPSPPCLARAARCAEALALFRDHNASSLLVVDEAHRPLGIVTERDVVERITYLLAPDAPIVRAMSSPVVNIRSDDYLFHGIAAMRRHGLRHLPVVDQEGRLVGLLRLEQALAVSMTRLLDLVDRLGRQDSESGLLRVKAAQAELVAGMLDGRVPATEIQSLLSFINNDLYRRVLEREIAALHDQGWGEPPVRFELIVMGSGGRQENLLATDQDNGMILDDYPDERHAEVDAYFVELASRVTAVLDRVGIPLCRGAVMATNPVWRKSRAQWLAQVNRWLHRPGPGSVRCMDIFADFAPLPGGCGFSAGLRQALVEGAPRQHGFLREMQMQQREHGLALSAFGRLQPRQEPGSRGSHLDLKYQGLMPLVECLRLLALKHGVAPTSSLARMEELNRRGVLDANEQDYLAGALQHLARLLLRQQCADFEADRAPSSRVPAAALSRRDKDMLTDGLSAIQRLRKRVDTEITGELF